jgi:C4-dicarboxylate transporter DctQ subunit
LSLSTKINVAFDHVLNSLAYMASLLILIAWVIVCGEIVMRYFFKNPLTWAVEFTEYIMLYTTFLGSAWLLREEGHVSINLVLSRLNPRTEAIINFITSIFGIMACSIIVWYGAKSTLTHYRDGIRAFTAMLLLKWPFIIIIPFGSLLLSIQFVRRAYGCWEKIMVLRNSNH